MEAERECEGASQMLISEWLNRRRPLNLKSENEPFCAMFTSRVLRYLDR